MADETKIHYEYWRKGETGEVLVIFRITSPEGVTKWWEYPVDFEDKAKEIAQLARYKKTRDGKGIPPQPGKALAEAKEAARGREREITEIAQKFEHGFPVGQTLSIKPKTKIPRKPPVNVVCPKCGNDVEEDYCYYCGHRVNWYDTAKGQRLRIKE